MSHEDQQANINNKEARAKEFSRQSLSPQAEYGMILIKQFLERRSFDTSWVPTVHFGAEKDKSINGRLVDATDDSYAFDFVVINDDGEIEEHAVDTIKFDGGVIVDIGLMAGEAVWKQVEVTIRGGSGACDDEKIILDRYYVHDTNREEPASA